VGQGWAARGPWYRRGAPGDGGYTRFCTAGEDLEHLSFGVSRLRGGEEWEVAARGEELLAVVLTGVVDAAVDGVRWPGLGGRATVFDGRATAVYCPPGRRLWVRAPSGPAVVALCGSPVPAGVPAPDPYVVRPEDVRVSRRGRPPFLREVHDILDEARPAARLVVGETFNAPGNWSSYPPHKHDEARGDLEVDLEELYFYQFDPPQGFGAQFLYTADGTLDEVHAVRHGDVVLIPYGYHPVAAAPGYRLYYLWVMAGDGRRLRPFDDPAHAWVKEAADRQA
jgi:5-deoxy-glucuronate isomerase